MSIITNVIKDSTTGSLNGPIDGIKKNVGDDCVCFCTSILLYKKNY